MSASAHNARIPLTFVRPGGQCRLAEIGDSIVTGQREQLTAYGLTPARLLTVLQQRPVTVILAEELELAIEHAVARDIWVESVA